MRLLISDQYSSLGPISHRLATIHPWQTTDRLTDKTTNRTISSTVTFVSTVG